MKRLLVGAVAFSCVVATAEARADLEQDADRIAEQWRGEGLEVERLPTMFLEQGRLRLLQLTPEKAREGCTSVAIIGSRGSDFVRSSDVTSARGRGGERALAGLLSFVRCGERKEELRSTAIEMRSQRGAVEVVVARGNQAASSPTDTLVERSVTLPTPPADPGRAPGHETLSARVARATARAKADGAVETTREVVTATNEGGGRMLVGFREGCHRLEVVSALGAAHRVVDVDAELRETSTDRLLGRDRSDTPDARLELCAGEATSAVLLFGGAPMGGEVVVLSSRWDLPPGLPTTWGPRARGAAARAMLARRIAPLARGPVHEAIGVSGTTPDPVEIEPRSCYLATVAAARGEARGMALTARVGSTTIHDDGGFATDASLVTFCSGRETRAHLSIDARGNGVAWLLGLWRVGDAPKDDP